MSRRWLVHPDMQKRLRYVRTSVPKNFTKVNWRSDHQFEHLKEQFCTRVIARLSEITVRRRPSKSWKEMLSYRII